MYLLMVFVIAALVLKLMTGSEALVEEEPRVMVIRVEQPPRRSGGCLQFVALLAFALLLAIVFSSQL